MTFLDPDVSLPPHLSARLSAELEPGESLLWAGLGAIEPPCSPLQFVRPLLSLILAGAVVVFGLAALSGEFGKLGKLVDSLIFVLVLLGGLALLVSILWLTASVNDGTDHRRLRKLPRLYAVTDRRALLWLPEYLKGDIHVISYRKHQITQVSRVEHADGTGDLLFDVSFRSAPHTVDRFERIRPAKPVEDLIRTTLMPDHTPPDGRAGCKTSSPTELTP